MRAPARLISAGCRVFRSSVEARHREFAAGRRVRLCSWHIKKLTGRGRGMGGLVLEMRVESQGRMWIPRAAPLGLGYLACI